MGATIVLVEFITKLVKCRIYSYTNEWPRVQTFIFLMIFLSFFVALTFYFSVSAIILMEVLE